MISFPPCKINLGLRVLAKRADGYHDIETCFFPIPWFDILEIIPSRDLTFTQTGLPIPGNEGDNLCLKAYQLLKNDFDLGAVSIHLHKILPTGAGLGGGSSDAAHTLRLLNEIFKLNLDKAQLKKYAALLGSDCSFFVEDKPMLGKGRGEILTEIQVNLNGKFIALVNPGIHVSTAEVYSGITPQFQSKSIFEMIEGVEVKAWREELQNDFETLVFTRHPAIAEIKKTFYSHGALYAAMSGSGSTVFGVFDHPLNLSKYFPGMTYWSGTL